MGAHRLTSESRTGANAYSRSYVLDGTGNRTSQTVGGTTTTALTNGTIPFNITQTGLPVNFTNPFSMTMVTTFSLTPGATMTGVQQGQFAPAATPLPSPLWMMALALGAVGVITARRTKLATA